MHELVIPARNYFGVGSLQSIGQFLHELGVCKVLVITDQGLSRAGLASGVVEHIENAGIPFELFDQLVGEPTREAVVTAAEVFERSGCDGIVGIGGGSPNDLAKAVGILVANGGDLRDYVGLNRSTVPSPPLVLVNTTAGTGSELSRAFIISDADGQKLVFKDDNALARVTINDPALMFGLPPDVTGATGMDALTHATEAYVSKRRQELSGELAKSAISLVLRHLPEAIEKPHNLDHRLGMIHAQSLAGMAFSSAGVGLAHAIAHPLGSMKKLPHGKCVGFILPYVVAFNARHVGDLYAELARCVLPGVPRNADDLLAVKELTASYINLSKIAQTYRLPQGINLGGKSIDKLASAAVLEPNCPNNPIEPTKDDVKSIIVAALDGEDPICLLA